MKLYERRMAQRLYSALNDVPGAFIGGGHKSVTVAGAVSFANDLQKVRGWVMEALMVMMDGSIADSERQALFDAAIKPAEDYIARRSAESWSSR
jgi:hypothetical protein